MTPSRLALLICCLLCWLAVSSCAARTASTGLSQERLSMGEQDVRTRELLREASRLMEGSDRRRNLSRVENMYLYAIDTYSESRLLPECFMGLLSLYLTGFDPPAFVKAEALRNNYLARYPEAPLKRTIDENLARAYVAHGEWEKLRRLYLPAIRRFVEAWNRLEPFALLMYSEAKYNLGDHEEARKGYTIVAKFFPESNEGKTALARIDSMRAHAAAASAVRQVQLPPPEQMLANRFDAPDDSLPANDAWKEVVASNGDRIWVSEGPGTPPHERTGQGEPTALAGMVGQPRSEQSVPAVVIPPDVQPPPENMEEKARMHDVSPSGMSIVPGLPTESPQNHQRIPPRKNRKGLSPPASTRPAVAAVPHTVEKSNENPVEDSGQSRMSVVADAQRWEPPVRKEASAQKTDKDERYSVQVGFFGNARNALSLADTLKKKGYDAFIKKHVRNDQKMFYRVLVGHFDEERNAVALAGILKQKEELNFIIFDQEK